MASLMNSRERVLCALNHQEPDRIPVTLAHETPEVIDEYCSVLGRGGGCVIGPTHSIAKDVPWKNIVAFYRAVEEYGVPLRRTS